MAGQRHKMRRQEALKEYYDSFYIFYDEYGGAILSWCMFIIMPLGLGIGFIKVLDKEFINTWGWILWILIIMGVFNLIIGIASNITNRKY